jgi:hypothetical protein
MLLSGWVRISGYLLLFVDRNAFVDNNEWHRVIIAAGGHDQSIHVSHQKKQDPGRSNTWALADAGGCLVVSTRQVSFCSFELSM